MTFLSYRLRSCIQLPLLLTLLWTWSGGWFCADGRQCEPLLTAACCCGENDGSEQEAPLGEGPALHVEAPPCGCYYDLKEADCLAGTRFAAEPGVPPAPGVAFTARPGELALPLPEDRRQSREPPPLSLCAPRGPPAA